MARILICHVPKDGTPARELGATLMGRGHFVSFDGEPDTPRPDRSARLRQFEAVIVLWTEHSVASAGLAEISREALPLNILASVRADNVPAASLPLVLRKLNMVSPREVDAIARLVARLSTAASSLKEIAAREAQREEIAEHASEAPPAQQAGPIQQSKRGEDTSPVGPASTEEQSARGAPQQSKSSELQRTLAEQASRPVPFRDWPVRPSHSPSPSTPRPEPRREASTTSEPTPRPSPAVSRSAPQATASGPHTPDQNPPPLARAHRPLVLPEVAADVPAAQQPQRRMINPPPLPTPAANKKPAPNEAAGVLSPEEFAALVDAGLLLVHIPHAIWLGEPIIVEVRLGRQQSHPRGGPPPLDRTMIETISVSLYGSEAFEIERQSERTQLVSDRFTGADGRDPASIGRWAWLITPRAAGNQDLVLRISALLRDRRGTPVPVALPDRRYPIAIHVPAGASLVSSLPGWLRR